ncbi:WD40 repeat-like protein [Rhizophagus irregularis]|uniref:WD40 repeat-like protein n=3 Tax=Rhizophagus irregularis TaxID=588596 RepID=A0A2I1E3J9_9GLOM|nr:quinon protein alcohol dehydrogenase-like superfamily [Rhizophagus irregularis DAOM 181602=DAOM 197198]EXX59388.1 Met30p [Rhizophagus irregularis DAOM 197198w]PKC13260.1 WD40 repeat-like protein [Rhizophagus irregularis]PKC76451.1 WD40 repeat-like protein [Rhizophagus irregularis]PKY16713.1 WD40 repeat-like protein [Rhizophagus irregularis]POG61841.1 quinon protein alcohol dehydrogenase-like superfamily [Rhizophagus irregularis DAOM 181602=DAOM 197198]|eukprot:XP_025168707.1 quinon protein alcohol dehydrogenase-like superfamily [Rhizophagus irregularis DAOM 181602=DAOM 197198]
MQENQEFTADLDFARLQVKDSSYNKQLELDPSLIKNAYNKQERPRNYYCYRHRPDLVKERMADELANEELQKQISKLSLSEQDSIAHIFKTFSEAPPQNRCVILQGILTQCCLTQLSFVSNYIKDLIRIDFIVALPSEISVKILSYLDAISLCQAAQVSKTWKRMADDDVVWHKLCEQHIDKKCYKCGWGLPLLDQKQKRNGKRSALNETSIDSPVVTTCISAADAHNSMKYLQHHTSPVSSPSNTNPSTPNTPSYDSQDEIREVKRVRISEDKTIPLYPDIPFITLEPHKTRPWKEVYSERLVVERNWRKGRYTVRSIKGHTDGILCLQFNEEYNRLITGSLDKTVRVWNLDTGELIHVLKGHTRCVQALQFDNVKLITGSMDHTLKLWNYHTGQCLNTLEGHTDGVVSLHFDNRIVASGSADHTIKVWNFSTSKCTTLRGHTAWVNCVVIYQKSQLLSCSDDQTIRIWDLITKTCTKVFDSQETHVASIQCIQPTVLCSVFNSSSANTSHKERSKCNDPDKIDEPIVISGSLDNTIKMWSLETGKCINTLFGHVEGVWSLAADKLRVASGAHDKSVKIWDKDSGKCMHTLVGHGGAVNCVALGDTMIVSGSEDCEIRIWDFKH